MSAGARNGGEFRAEPWLESPLRTAVGELQLAGMLRNIAGIDPRAMRILGSYALVLMAAGRGYFCDARGTKRNLEPGDAVLVYPEIAHAYGPAEGGEWTQVYFVFAGAQFDLWRKKGLLKPEEPVWRVGAPDYWRQRLEGVIRGQAAEAGTAARVEARGAVGAVRALGKFLEVLTEMMAAHAARGSEAAREAWLERSMRLLAERRGGTWLPPQAVAREVGLSYENFRKRFAQLSGESPGHYQKRRRLESACAAIYHGERTLKEIADELGFCDVFHFSKAFKQVVGATPSEYRERVRGGARAVES